MGEGSQISHQHFPNEFGIRRMSAVILTHVGSETRSGLGILEGQAQTNQRLMAQTQVQNCTELHKCLSEAVSKQASESSN